MRDEIEYKPKLIIYLMNDSDGMPRLRRDRYLCRFIVLAYDPVLLGTGDLRSSPGILVCTLQIHFPVNMSSI